MKNGNSLIATGRSRKMPDYGHTRWRRGVRIAAPRRQNVRLLLLLLGLAPFFIVRFADGQQPSQLYSVPTSSIRQGLWFGPPLHAIDATIGDQPICDEFQLP